MIAFLYDFSTLFMGKYSENKRKLAIKNHHSADFRLCLPPSEESPPDNVKAGRDGTNTAPPTRIQ